MITNFGKILIIICGNLTMYYNIKFKLQFHIFKITYIPTIQIFIFYISIYSCLLFQKV